MRRISKSSALVALTVAAFLLPAWAAAGVIPAGDYPLLNHPDGNQAPPFYGVRLDNLHDDGVFLFDVACAACDITLEYDGADTIHISGSAFGGHKDGNGFRADDPFSGLYEFDFTFRNVMPVGGDTGGFQDIGTQEDPDNNGTLSFAALDLTWDLRDKQGDNPFSFRFGDGDDGLGHRGAPGISGWGWLLVKPDGASDYEMLDGSQDWLFTTPEPGTLVWMALGLTALAFRRRRRA